MANFVKSSCVLSIPHPGGGTSQINGYMVCWSGLKFTISTPDGSKVLAMKSYHQKSVDTSYMILTTTPDTDGSVATEDTSASTRDLAADEYRVCVTHKGYEGTNESIMSDQQLFFPYEKISQWGGLRWYLKGAPNEGRAVQVTFDGVKVPTITDIELHVTETSTGSMVFGGLKVDTDNGLMSLKAPQKLSMLVKRDDGSVWTLGGGDVPPNVVTTDGEQAVTAVKTFTAVPKVTAEPTAKDDVATVGFINGMIFGKGPFKTDLSFICEPTSTSNWVVVSNAEIILENGKKLKCIHLENTSPSSATAPVKCVFKLIDESEAIAEAPQSQDASFFDTYSLKEGELKGTVTYGHLLNSEWQEYASYLAPFYTYNYGCTGASKESPLMHISIDDVPAAVSKLKITIASSYVPKTMKATVVCGGMSASTDLIENPTAQAYELEFNTTGAGGLVTLDSEQTITGKKHFDVMPQSSATPSDPEDLVTLGFLDTKIDSSVAVTDVLVSIKASDNYYQCIKEIKFKTAGGQFLVPVYLENVQVKDATAPVRFVFKLSDTYSSTVQWKESDFFKDYQLKEGEFFGSYVAAHILDARWMEYENENNEPFRQYIAWTTTEPRGLWPLMRYEFQNLPSELKQVEYTVGYTSSYPDCFSEISFLVNSGLKSFESEVYKDGLTLNSEHLVEFVYKKLNPVIVETEQTITGKKTFTVLPKSEVEPKDKFDLVNKRYVDAMIPGERTEVVLKAEVDSNGSHGAFHDIKFTLANGKFLVPVYMENTSAPQANGPVKAVFKVADAASLELEYKAPTFFDDYELKDAELFGSITFCHLLSQTYTDHNLVDYQHPFKNYIITDSQAESGTRLSPALKYTFEKLSAEIKSMSITNGSAAHSGGYPLVKMALDCTTGSKLFKSKVYTKDADGLAANSVHEITFDWVEAEYVTVASNQEVTGLKTFKVLPQSEATPADEKDLATKKYVDEKVASGGGGGSATPPANMVTTDTEQTITALKTFDKLPKSTAEPADNAELVNKKYVDDKVAAGGGASGAAPGNMVTTDTEQSITALKTFSILPRSSVLPKNRDDFTNKKYITQTCVLLTEDQTVNGIKTFNALPKSSATPTYPEEFATKKYVDGLVTSGTSELQIYAAQGSYSATLGFTEMQAVLLDGRYLNPKYMVAKSDYDATYCSLTPIIFEVSDTPMSPTAGLTLMQPDKFNELFNWPKQLVGYMYSDVPTLHDKLKDHRYEKWGCKYKTRLSSFARQISMTWDTKRPPVAYPDNNVPYAVMGYIFPESPVPIHYVQLKDSYNADGFLFKSRVGNTLYMTDLITHSDPKYSDLWSTEKNSYIIKAFLNPNLRHLATGKTIKALEERVKKLEDAAKP